MQDKQNEWEQKQELLFYVQMTLVAPYVLSTGFAEQCVELFSIAWQKC